MKNTSIPKIAFIPARSLSKRVPNKNFRPLAGRSLVARTVDQALAAKIFDKIIISTDRPELIDDLGLPESNLLQIHKRSAATSGDFATTNDVINEAAKDLALGECVIAILQPTSPLRKSADISGAMKLYDSGRFESVVSTRPLPPEAAWSMEIVEGQCRFLYPEGLTKRSQDIHLQTLNGAIYIATLSHIQIVKSFFKGSVGGYPMTEENSVDIDTEQDWKAAETLIIEQDL